jgi:hypothetical protein
MWRYSLRTFLVLSALVPVAVYWLALPTLNAQRFTSAIAARDYPAAEALCATDEDKFPGHWTEHKTFEPKAGISPLTWDDFRRGERRLYVGIAYGDGSGLASCGLECTATRRGIELGMMAP